MGSHGMKPPGKRLGSMLLYIQSSFQFYRTFLADWIRQTMFGKSSRDGQPSVGEGLPGGKRPNVKK